MITSDSLLYLFSALPYAASFGFGAGGGGLVGSIIVSRARAKSERALAALRNDYETESRKLQARLDRASGVHQLRVGREFKALTDVWEKVVATRRTMAGLRPLLDFRPAGEDAKMALERRFPAFADALEQMKGAVFAGHPLFPLAINRELEELVRHASAEYFDVAPGWRADAADWCQRGEKHNDDFGVCADRLSGLIRARFDELSQVRE